MWQLLVFFQILRKLIYFLPQQFLLSKFSQLFKTYISILISMWNCLSSVTLLFIGRIPNSLSFHLLWFFFFYLFVFNQSPFLTRSFWFFIFFWYFLRIFNCLLLYLNFIVEKHCLMFTFLNNLLWRIFF